MVSLITINSVSKSSTSSATPVANLISNWGNNPIVSCVLGISKIGRASLLSNNIAHAALLLLNKKIDYDQDTDDEIENLIGILIEYGDYSPKMASTEEDYFKKGLVIYHYGEKGGLRYYVKKYSEFIEEFGDKGYVDLNIDVNNQKTFEYFINKIAKKENDKWIKANYSVGLNNFNCQTFAIEAIKEIKPSFNVNNVNPSDATLAKKKTKQKLDFIPSNIRSELMNFYH